MNTKKLIVTALQICLSIIFLWAFADKLLGLGFSTCADKTTGTVAYSCNAAWIHGGSPTAGFLLHGTHGPFTQMFQTLAGNILIDWLFMAGLLGIGLALLCNKFMKLAVWSGIIMLGLMYLAVFPLATPAGTNPMIDEHIIYMLVLGLLLFV